MDNNGIGVLFAIVVIAAIAIGSIVWTNNRSQQIIEQWAQLHGYQILSFEQRYFRLGPFFWTTSRNQTVYYVTLVAQDGATRHAWVRCGSWWLGVLFTDDIDVRWDD